MLVRSAFSAVLVLLLGCATRGQTTPPAEGLLHLEQTIPLPQVEGRIDHMAFDPADKRLYVAALGNGTVEVIDAAAGKHVASIPGFKEAQGIAVVPEPHLIAIASGGDGCVRLLDPGTLKVTATIKDLDDADNVRYDASARLLYVGYGDGSLAVIDPAKGEKVGEIKLEAHPESFQLETRGPRIFVNVPHAHQIAIIDRQQRKVVDHWKVEGASANFPMALDEENHRLLIGCRNPAEVLVLDAVAGRKVASDKCPGDTDDLFLDAANHRVYVTGGDGTLAVFRQTDADHYEALATIQTAPGARTSRFVPSLGRLYVAAPHRGDHPSALLVYAVTP